MPADQRSIESETETFCMDRAARGDRAAFLRFLDEAGDEAPVEGDTIEAD